MPGHSTDGASQTKAWPKQGEYTNLRPFCIWISMRHEELQAFLIVQWTAQYFLVANDPRPYRGVWRID